MRQVEVEGIAAFAGSPAESAGTRHAQMTAVKTQALSPPLAEAIVETLEGGEEEEEEREGGEERRRRRRRGKGRRGRGRRGRVKRRRSGRRSRRRGGGEERRRRSRRRTTTRSRLMMLVLLKKGRTERQKEKLGLFLGFLASFIFRPLQSAIKASTWSVVPLTRHGQQQQQQQQQQPQRCTFL